MMASLYPAPLRVDEVLPLIGIDHLARRRTQKLSGGETQRVRFALALVSNPEVLVLDEPTVALDVEARHAFWTTMRAFAEHGKTVLFATHHLEEADAYADRAILMANGGVVADRPTNELKAMVGRRTAQLRISGVLGGGEARTACVPASLLYARDLDSGVALRGDENGDVEDSVLLCAEQLLAVIEKDGSLEWVEGKQLGHRTSWVRFRNPEPERQGLLEGHVLRLRVGARKQGCDDNAAALDGLADSPCIGRSSTAPPGSSATSTDSRSRSAP
jgi:ABC transporter